MDRVRFGRALGVGAREAAKALVKAADAATAPNPAPSTPRPSVAGPSVSRPAAAVVAQKIVQAKAAHEGVKRGGKRFGQALWGPVTKASGTIFLEVMGVLFGLFAFVFAAWVWKVRADLWGSAGVERQRAWFAVTMLVVFGYFTVSSYTRAARRGKP